VKNSSVALTVGLVEVTAAARSIQEFSFQALLKNEWVTGHEG